MKPNRMLARSKANQLLKSLNILSPPVPLNLILQQSDLTEFPVDFSTLGVKNVAALLAYETGQIFYDTNSPYVRRRFSVAHELGHYILDHKNVFGHAPDFYTEDSRKPPQEIEADQFAAELLIPFEWVKKDRMSGLRKPEDLAKKYLVSIEAMRWRLINSDVLLSAK
jgi:Zn-dependent peptidase ImmA (M78 family)